MRPEIWVVLATAPQVQRDRALELRNLINPIHHSATTEAVERYKVEPYVVCADVNGAPPHTGRVAWDTGSASWLYRVALEAILGFHPEGRAIRLDPCIPRGWPGFAMDYRHGSATYRVRLDNSAGSSRGVPLVVLDARPVPGGALPLIDDRRHHEIRLELG